MLLPNGLIYLTELRGKFKSNQYIELLKNYVLPLIKLNFKNFQIVQDNCRVHTSNLTKEFFNSNSINVLTWPANSPDLNLMENIWKMMSDEIYSDCQPRHLDELRSRIFKAAWELMNTKRNIMIGLYTSYRERLTFVLKNNGNLIN